ncbi:MAG TPA: chemotaxis protein CheW, partial [Polyangiaceae bacterium]
MEAKRGGVVVRLEGGLLFVPASLAVAIAPVPQITRVPGAPEAILGAAMHDGDVVPVIVVGAAR